MKQPKRTYTETQVRKAVQRKLKARGFDCLPMTGVGRRGFPDTMVIGTNGSVFFIEFKKSGAGARPDQKEQIKKLNARGVPAFVINDPKQLQLEPTEGMTKIGTTAKPENMPAKPTAAEQLRKSADEVRPKIVDMDGNTIERAKGPEQ